MVLVLLRLLPLVMVVFKVAMLVHAIQRRASQYWLFIIVVAPFGEFIYLFMEYLPAQQRRTGRARRPAGGPAARSHGTEGGDRLRRPENVGLDVPAVAKLVEHGQHEEAVAWLEAHLDDHPDDARAAILLGRALAGLGDHEAAIERFEQVGQAVRGPRRETVRKHLVASLVAVGRPEDATPHLQALVDASGTPRYRLQLARHLKTLGQPDEARAQLDALFQAAARADKQGFGYAHSVVEEARRLQEELA